MLTGMRVYSLRIVAAALALLLVVLVLFSCVLFFTATSIMEEQAGANAQNIAVTTASFLQDNVSAYRHFIENPDVSGEYYTKLHKILSNICTSDAIRFVYTERRINEDTVIYLLDSEPSDSVYASPPGAEDKMNPLRLQAYADRQPCHGRLVNTDFWGYYITAYAPIIDPNNQEFLGLVGADVPVEFENSLFKYYLWEMAITVLATVLIVGTVMFIFSGNISGALIFDNLTGAYNRKYFDKALKRMCLKNISKKTFCLLLLDLDHFKRMNDEYGHQFGDTVLKATVSAVSSALRADDLLARFGGEEFVILLPNTTLSAARRISRRILDVVRSNIIYNDQIHEYKTVTLSIGIAQFREKLTPESIIHLADMAMYEAKKTRNTAAYYDHQTEKPVVEA